MTLSNIAWGFSFPLMTFTLKIIAGVKVCVGVSFDVHVGARIYIDVCLGARVYLDAYTYA